jgi:condensin-2 complex subunit H2
LFVSLFQINFTEAALFLQGTATVYSKKVEFLWQSVLKMLELLASKKALDEVDGTDGTG